MLANSTQFKLQLAPKVGTCDVGFVGEQYSDVSAISSVQFYSGNTNFTDGSWIDASGLDPSHNGDAAVLQSLETANSFTPTNDILAGQDGLWDFALGIEAASLGGGYCMRIVHANGTPLDTYTDIPEIYVPPKVTQQLRHGRFFSAGEESQPFGWRR